MKVKKNSIDIFENKCNKLIYMYIKNNKKVTKKNLIEDLGITEGQIKYGIKILKQNELIVSIGEKKNTCYIIKESEENKVE